MHALGVVHSVRNVKYLVQVQVTKTVETRKIKTHSSPIFSILNSPHLLPTSDSRKSSGRLTIVAPTASAIRLLSDLRTRRMHDTFDLSNIP